MENLFQFLGKENIILFVHTLPDKGDFMLQFEIAPCHSLVFDQTSGIADNN